MRGGANSISIWALPLVLLAAAAAVFALDLGGAATRLSGLEYGFYQHAHPRPYEDSYARGHFHVRLLHIDDKAAEKYGRWPWAADQLARVTEGLKKAGAPIVIYAFALDAGDPASPQRFAAQLPDDAQNAPARAALNQMISPDEAFAESLNGIGAATGYTLADDDGDDRVSVKAPITQQGAPNALNYLPRYSYALRALPLIESASTASGALNLTPDRDGVFRSLPLVNHLGGETVPAIDLDALRAGLGAVVLHGADGTVPGLDADARLANISVGNTSIATRRDSAITIWFARDPAARVLDASSVLGADVLPDLKNSIVIVAPPGKTVRTPVGLMSVGDIHA